ncbi:MAG: glycerophosphodiester phosphodiesterase family protein [Halanaerobiales bacterium]|nr:glycerophosphodiester phosphodiesterase family protein [Halanaerobiales bacterium]
MTDIIAHRGSSSSAPENSKASLLQALKDGATGVEIDLQLTSDNEVVVIHDETIDRTSSGLGFVKDMTLKELKEYDIGSFFDPKFKAERIITLKEALELLKNSKIINIEIKKMVNFNHNIEKEVVKVLEGLDLNNKIIVSSFNHDSLDIIKNINNKIITAPLFYARVHNPWEYAKRLGSKYLHLYYKAVDNKLIQNCHKNNIKVNVFTVDKKEDLKKMIEFNVDGIITNYPLRALEILKK